MANTDDLVLLSLYSGLGGAELFLGMLHKSVTKELKHLHDKDDFLWMESPKKPFFFASCDVDGACQKVLDQHKDPSVYIVADILDFIKPETLAHMENLVATAKKELAALKGQEKAQAKAHAKTMAKAKGQKVRGRGRGQKSRAKPRKSDVDAVPSDGSEFLRSRIQMLQDVLFAHDKLQYIYNIFMIIYIYIYYNIYIYTISYIFCMKE